jgi:hypothetical protein
VIEGLIGEEEAGGVKAGVDMGELERLLSREEDSIVGDRELVGGVGEEGGEIEMWLLREGLGSDGEEEVVIVMEEEGVSAEWIDSVLDLEELVNSSAEWIEIEKVSGSIAGNVTGEREGDLIGEKERDRTKGRRVVVIWVGAGSKSIRELSAREEESEFGEESDEEYIGELVGAVDTEGVDMDVMGITMESGRVLVGVAVEVVDEMVLESVGSVGEAKERRSMEATTAAAEG